MRISLPAMHLLTMADKAMIDQRWEDAFVCATASITCEPTAMGWSIKAHALLKMTENIHRRIEGCARSALVIDEQSVPALINLTSALLRQHRFAEALEALKTALQIDPTNQNTRNNYTRLIAWLREAGKADELDLDLGPGDA